MCVHARTGVQESMFNSFYLLFFNLAVSTGAIVNRLRKKINNAADVNSSTVTFTFAGPSGGSTFFF